MYLRVMEKKKQNKTFAGYSDPCSCRKTVRIPQSRCVLQARGRHSLGNYSQIALQKRLSEGI